MDERKPPTAIAETDPESAEYWFGHCLQEMHNRQLQSAIEKQKDAILEQVRAQIQRIQSVSGAQMNVKLIVQQRVFEAVNELNKKRLYRLYEALMQQEGIEKYAPLDGFDKVFEATIEGDPRQRTLRSKKSSAMRKGDKWHSPMAQVRHIERFKLQKSQIVVMGSLKQETGEVVPHADHQQYRIIRFTVQGKAVIEPIDSLTKEPLPDKKREVWECYNLFPLEFVEAQRAASEKA